MQLVQQHQTHLVAVRSTISRRQHRWARLFHTYQLRNSHACAQQHSLAPSCQPCRPPASRGTALRSVATESLTGQQQPLVLGSYDEAAFEPSNDLRELAAAQLQSLFQVLRRVSPGSAGSCKACVYARRADSLEAPQMKLQRVACCKSAQPLPPAVTLGYSGGSTSSSSSSSSSSDPGSSNSFEELDETLTLHRAAWEPGSSSSSSSSPCETEALLINEEIVLLPSSNLLVLPLAEAGVLVGLLVVEVRSKPGSPVPYQPQPLQQQQGQQQEQQPAWELPPVLGLSEDVLWALRMSVPPLAKACAMDLRTALAGAQQEARQRLARSLLLEARGPLKVLSTFGGMLAPRLRTGQSGEPESDMADGMILQGQRLADVVAQLEAALRPAAAAAAPGRAAGSLSAGSSSSSNSSSGEWLTPQQQQQVQQQQQPWREPLALPAAAAAMDDGDMSDGDDSWAVADSPEQQQQQQVQAAADSGSSAGSSRSAKLLGPGRQQQPQPQLQLQQVVVAADLVPGQRTADCLESSSRDIRWSEVDAPAARKGKALPPALQTQSSSGSSSSSTVYVPNASSFDAARTIDLEPQLPDNSGSGTPAAAAAATWNSSASASARAPASAPPTAAAAADSGLMQLVPAAAADGVDASQQQRGLKRQRQQQQQVKRPVQRAVCNVVEVLSHLLSAAAGLAQLQGINLIINDPLSLEPPGSSSSSKAGSSDGSSTALVLLPRPVRPLMAGVAGNVCRRVLGYCIDVALQCTPRNGQVCVTARASSGGVEVSLMHTGQAQPNRLHTSTASMDAAALGPAVAGGGVATLAGAAAASEAPAAATGAAGSLLRRRSRQQQQGASSSSSSAPSDASHPATSSSSSRWSSGLQELSASSGIRGGSSLITLDFARQVLHSIGGRLSLTYPCHFINAMTGQLEVGSNIEVWLPPPAPSTAG